MEDFKFNPTDSQEENLQSFFAYAIEKDPLLGQILYDNRDLLLQFETELPNTKKQEIRTVINNKVKEALNL